MPKTGTKLVGLSQAFNRDLTMKLFLLSHKLVLVGEKIFFIMQPHLRINFVSRSMVYRGNNLRHCMDVINMHYDTIFDLQGKFFPS